MVGVGAEDTDFTAEVRIPPPVIADASLRKRVATRYSWLFLSRPV